MSKATRGAEGKYLARRCRYQARCIARQPLPSGIGATPSTRAVRHAGCLGWPWENLPAMWIRRIDHRAATDKQLSTPESRPPGSRCSALAPKACEAPVTTSAPLARSRSLSQTENGRRHLAPVLWPAAQGDLTAPCKQKSRYQPREILQELTILIPPLACVVNIAGLRVQISREQVETLGTPGCHSSSQRTWR